MTNRFVIDTNIFISGLLFKSSVPFRGLELATKQGIILYSEVAFQELEQVLNRSTFDKYLSQGKRYVFYLNLPVNVT